MSNPSSSISVTPTRVERPSRPSPNLALDASLYAKTHTNGFAVNRSNPASPFHTNFLHAHLSSDAHAEPSSAREGRAAPPSTPLPTGMSRSTSATEPRGLHASSTSRFHQSHSFSNSPVVAGGFAVDSSPDSSPLSSPAGPRSMLSPGIITRAGAAEEASKIRLPSVSAAAQGVVVSPPRNGNNVAPRTLSYAVSGVDEYPEEDEDDPEDTNVQRSSAVGGLPIKPSSNSQLASRFENQTHPEPPFHVKDVSRGGNNSRANQGAKDNFPPFSPSELRPYSSPSPNSKLTYRSASHLEAEHAENEFLQVPAAATQSGFSPKHANWDQSHPYDESYEVEGSDDGKTPSASPKQSPLRRPASIPQSNATTTSSPPPLRMNSQRQTQQQMMSPTTRSAVDSIVPALSWLLILNRKLQLSGAITGLQSKHLKSQILAGNPALLSAVDRFVKGKNQDAIIQALMSCLPEDEVDNSVDAAREAAREAEDENEDDEEEDYEDEEGEDDEEEEEEDGEFEADYKAIMHGRGQGGHKPTPTRARTTPGTEAAKLISSPRLDFGTDPARRRDKEGEESEEEEEENPLLIANTLVPLSLPQLESLGSLLRSLGFSLLDMETLSLCTSALLTPVDRNSNASGAGVTVSSAQWNECIKSLRLHSHNPKLFTHLLQSLFRILDLQQSDSVPYGELVSSIAVFCRGKPKQKLQFIFQALRHSSGSGLGAVITPTSTSSAFSHNSSPSSPTDPSVSYLPCTIIYGFLFSFSLTLHVLLALALSPSGASLEQRLDTITQTINVQNKAVWSLTNGFYALFDRQFETASSNTASSAEDQDATISYKQFVQWHHSPVFIIETLLERSGQ